MVQIIKPKKKLGQNVLIDKEIISLIVKSAEIKKDELVIEPGCGTGVVTRELIDTEAEIVGVEIDDELIPTLQNQFKSAKNFHLKVASVLDLDFQALAKGKDYKVVGSIPYQISSPLIHKILFEDRKPKVVCIVLQKEVAEKILGGVGVGTYLSNMVELFYESKIVVFIKPEAFNPIPKVESALLLLTLKSEIIDIDLKKFKGFLHKAFANRRKMLNKTFSIDELQQAEINPMARPQEIPLKQFIKLYHKT